MPGTTDVLVSGMTFVTETDMISRIRHILNDTGWRDALSGAYSPGDGTMGVGAGTSWEVGDIIDPDDGTGSLLRVSATPTTNTISVQESYNGTTDVAHSSGTALMKNPRFRTIDVMDAIVAAIAADCTPSHVWFVASTSITPVSPPTTNLYALPENFYEVIADGIFQQTTATVTDIYTFPRGSYEILRNVPTNLAPYGKALRFLGGSSSNTNPIYINYKASVTLTTMPDGDYAELIVNAACARLLGAAEVPEGDTLRSRPSGGADRGTAAWFRLRKQEVRQLIRAKLRDLAPPERRYVSDRTPRGNW